MTAGEAATAPRAGLIVARIHRAADVLQPPVVTQHQDNRRGHNRTERDHHKAIHKTASSGVLDQPENIRAEESAQVAQGVDQGDPASSRGAGKHRGRRVQKVGPVDDWPIAAITSITIVSTGSVISAVAISPAAPTE